MAITFTTNKGDTVAVAEEDTVEVERNPNYRVLQARVRGNPGEILTKVVYNNPGGMDMFQQADVSQAVEDLDELEGEHDPMMNSPECTCDWGQGHVCPVHPGRALDPHGLNPGGVGASVISWRNLRLAGAIMGEKKTTLTGRGKQAVRKISNIGAALGRLNQNTSIRNHPEILMIATAEHWFDYIRNMDAIDVGAELSAEVSPQEQLSIYHFLKEWEMDPTHRAFRNRVTVGADIDSELAKGQIVYDILTSSGPDPLKSNDYANHRYDKMFRLGMDILSSIRLNTYNYYTLNRMHVQEGDRVFMDFRSRYIALGADEVSMVKEMESNVAHGKSYAFRTTSDENQALEADELMRKAVSSYQVGDTRTTRSILDVLRAAPYSYSPLHERITGSHVAGGDKNVKFERGEKFHVKANLGKGTSPVPDKYTDGNMMWVIVHDDGGGTPINANKGELQNADKNQKAVLIVIKSFFDDTRVGIIKVVNKKWTFLDYSDDFLKPGQKTFDDSKNRSKHRKLSDAVKTKNNPKAKGRGKFLFLEIHPKSQLTMKRGTGEQKHGKSTNTAKWTKGLNKVFPGTQLIQVGKHKKTGEEAPYRIRLPISHFKGVTHPTEGYRTIGMKKGDSKLKAAWQKILDTYGMPKHSPTKGTYYRFTIDKSIRGPYYDDVRRKVGKAKS